MAEISKIILPSGSTYDLKDAVARKFMSGAIYLCGATTTPLSDNSATPTSVVLPDARTIRGVDYAAGASYSPVSGDAFFQDSKEYVWDGARWHKFGDVSGLGELGELAYKDYGSVTVELSGQVSAPTISVESEGATTTIKNPTAQTVVTDIAPANAAATTAEGELVYCSVSGEALTLKKFVKSTGASITTEDKTVKTGDASYSATASTFSTGEQTFSVSFGNN